ncbi:hypothetical protein QE152_g36242 [Popillia japonica]|uniref:Uncharacterized protein n=1 Tax=Popillia japonica TaxID=7064 RepID=A0AAW1IDS6_POPJA
MLWSDESIADEDSRTLWAHLHSKTFIISKQQRKTSTVGSFSSNWWLDNWKQMLWSDESIADEDSRTLWAHLHSKTFIISKQQRKTSTVGSFSSNWWLDNWKQMLWSDQSIADEDSRTLWAHLHSKTFIISKQ